MVILTIPKKMTSNDDLVVIPRRECEAFIKPKSVREFSPSRAQKKALAASHREYKAGRYLTFNELKRKLDAKG